MAEIKNSFEYQRQVIFQTSWIILTIVLLNTSFTAHITAMESCQFTCALCSKIIEKPEDLVADCELRSCELRKNPVPTPKNVFHIHCALAHLTEPCEPGYDNDPYQPCSQRFRELLGGAPKLSFNIIFYLINRHANLKNSIPFIKLALKETKAVEHAAWQEKEYCERKLKGGWDSSSPKSRARMRWYFFSDMFGCLKQACKPLTTLYPDDF